MRRLALSLLVSLGLLLAACVDPPVAAHAASCTVGRVVDGDTLHLSCNGTAHKVRLLGYDTPEIYHPLCPAERQAGEAASEILRRLAASGPVTGVQFSGHDRYGRDLAHMQIAGQDVSAFMLTTPLARPYRGHKHPDWCHLLGA